MLNIESGNHLKEMSVNSHGYVKFGPERKEEFSFCSKQGKIFVSRVQDGKKGNCHNISMVSECRIWRNE